MHGVVRAVVSGTRVIARVAGTVGTNLVRNSEGERIQMKKFIKEWVWLVIPVILGLSMCAFAYIQLRETTAKEACQTASVIRGCAGYRLIEVDTSKYACYCVQGEEVFQIDVVAILQGE